MADKFCSTSRRWVGNKVFLSVSHWATALTWTEDALAPMDKLKDPNKKQRDKTLCLDAI